MCIRDRPCTVPAAGEPGCELADDEMEIGIGIHGEPGVEKKPLETADEIVDTLLEKILADIDYAGSEVAVMINAVSYTHLKLDRKKKKYYIPDAAWERV